MNSSHDESHWTGFAKLSCSHTLASAMSYCPSPPLWDLTSKCSEERHSLGHMVSPGNPLLQRRWGVPLSGALSVHSTMRNRLRPGRAFQNPEVNHPALPATSWSIFIKKDLHANFRICLPALFAKSVRTVAWKEIQRDRVMGVDDC